MKKKKTVNLTLPRKKSDKLTQVIYELFVEKKNKIK